MANADRPRGFHPAGPLLRSTPYTADGIIYPGDACVLEADGKVVVAAAGDGTQLVGMALSYASAAGQEVRIADHPDQEFSCQADETEASSVAVVGASANILATAGDSTYKQSRQELDSSDIGTTATAQLRIVKLQPGPKNAWGNQADVIVRINQHEYVDGTAV